MMQEPALRAGFAKLKDHGLSFDVWVMHPQLGDVYDLAKDHPDTTVVIDHVGGPMRIGRYASGDHGFREWRAGLARLAQLPKTYVKLGGLNMPPCTGLAVSMDAGCPWTSQQMADVQGPYVHAAIDLFGPDRCMFESNFPVDRMLTGARSLWNCFKRVASRYSPSEKEALFATTAARIYRLNLETQPVLAELK
jgi:predicted TIM-barrel fold metal-dependent hydrolase